MNKVGFLVVILFLNLESIQPKQDESCLLEDGAHCHTSDPKPYRHYGTKTTYKEALDDTPDDLDWQAENCSAEVFYLFSRHATRYPDTLEIEDMMKILPVLKEKIINASRLGKAQLCAEDVDKLRKWTLAMVPADGKRLSVTGEIEAEELGGRFKERFPSLLNQSYSPDLFVFGYTKKDRTRSTAEAFAKGLFDYDQYRRINFENKTNDEVLTFHKSCKALQTQCKFPSYDLSEIEKVTKSDLMKAMVERVSKRAGVPLTIDNIKIINRACNFGYALGTGDVWCSLLSTVDLKVLEFEGDIDDYYKDAYGNKINYEQACPVAKYVMDLFKSSDNSSEPKVALHFSHAGAIKKVFAMFGLFKDDLSLTADAFCSQRDRKWRSSKVVPFNANLALVLFRCGSERKVAVFHNERSIRIRGCTDKLCSFTEFETVYGPLAQTCDINKICCTCCKL